ncbi:hypothetical protein ACHAW6_003269 [Cyclotella cf. meneghiniana]
MVTIGTKHALQCGGLMQAWHEWRRLPSIQHTWLNLKNHWTAAFNEQCDISCLTGCTLMTQANAAVNDIQWSSQMIPWLDNLANTAVQKNDTVDQLVIANKQLTDTITKLQEDNAKLLHIIQQLEGHTPGTNKHQPTTSKWDPKGFCHPHG